MLKFTFIAIFASTYVHGIDLEYYWKDYTGQVPRDAIVGGQNLNGENIYIGQAYITDGGERGGGIIVAEIHPNITEVKAQFYGVRKSKSGVKILCSTNPKQLSWTRSSTSQMHLDLIGKHAVIGGTEGGNVLYVGRVFHNGQTRIGKLAGGTADDIHCYFISGDSEHSTQSFEVLTFKRITTSTVLCDPDTIATIIDIRDG